MDSAFDFVIDTCGQNDNEAAAGLSATQTNNSEGTISYSQSNQTRNNLFCLAEDSILAKLLSEYQTTLKTNDVVKPKLTASAKQQQTWHRGGTKKSKTVTKADVQAILKKSVITPEFEQLHSVPAYEISDKKLREMRKVCCEVMVVFCKHFLLRYCLERAGKNKRRQLV